MRPVARVVLPFLLGAIACYSAGGDGGEGGGGSGNAGSSSGGKASGGSSSGGKASGGSSTGGKASGGSSSGGSSTAGLGGTTSNEAGKTSGGGAGVPECEQVACLRPYECVLECGGEVLYSGCCPCEAPTFDGFIECQAAGAGGGGGGGP